MQADPDRRSSVAGHQVMDDVQPEPDGVSGLGDAQHECVADGLHVRPAERWKLRVDRGAEVGDERGGFVVAVGFGQCGEAGDVSEQERRRRAWPSYSRGLGQVGLRHRARAPSRRAVAGRW